VKGRRVAVEENADPIGKVTEPGDYYGPVTGFTGDRPAVFFLLPNARDPETEPWERGISHVTSPPHTFHEQPDGTLTIHASILSVGVADGQRVNGWHGFLEAGEWRQV
jgi:hypothetical protein